MVAVGVARNKLAGVGFPMLKRLSEECEENMSLEGFDICLSCFLPFCSRSEPGFTKRFAFKNPVTHQFRSF